MKETLKKLRETLVPIYGKRETEAIIRLIFHHLKGWNLTDMLIHQEDELSDFIREEINKILERLKEQEPIQYILGEARFHGMDLKIRPGVLIPRPETDDLVDLIIDENNGRDDLRILDVCTGSGCIACSIAYEHPQVSVVATDISPVAVSLAQENVAALGLSERVAVLCCDLAEKIPERLMGTFDLVVSNPPYIPTAVLATLDAQVRDFEPTLALDGGEDGNDFVRRILPWALVALKPGGAFALELHETCLEAAQTYAQELGFVEVRITKDLTGADRILSGRKM